MKVLRNSIVKRGISIFMMIIMAFLFPATVLSESESRAASAKKDTEYIKEVKLFVKKGGTASDAKAWCESEEGDWKVVEGDEEGNINSQASGAFSDEVGVFICYTTTKDPDEAVTDLAVMNEKGNYSEGEYEMLMKKQKQSYIDMVGNMKTMLVEYRKNYEKGTAVAVKSHDFLNSFKEDDSGKLLGDFLLTASDDEIAEVLLQCNGIVVLTIQEKIAAACDTAKTTWLDRMSKLGSYDKLKSALSKNMKQGSVQKELDRQYKEKATLILDMWDDLHKHFDNIKGFADETGLDSATEEEFNKWQESAAPGVSGYATYTEYLTLSGLARYKYGDKTLLDFFNKTKKQIINEGIETLYPMAACLTDGQMSALSESLGLYQMIQDAFAASLVNDNNAGEMAEAKKTVDENMLDDAKDAVSNMDEMLENVTEGDKISIYEGVDRDVFKGGVAVTTDAKTMSAGSESSWTDIFVKNGDISELSLIMDAVAFTTATLACIFATLANSSLIHEMNVVMSDAVFHNLNGLGLSNKTVISLCGTSRNVRELSKMAKTNPKAAEALKEVHNKVLKKGSGNFRIYNGLKWGLAVFTILLAAADIALSVYALYKYYNTPHLPIPHHIVDLAYGDTGETAYVAYKSVRDQDGNCSDTNGYNSKQWLALYYTKDRSAGEPILAPTEGKQEILVKTGTDEVPGDGYSPIHMFGTVNTAQNLTFADGESGYSYNDKVNGTYVYFKHASDTRTDIEAIEDEGAAEDKSIQTGTVMESGKAVLFVAIGMAAGCVIGSRRRRKTGV